MRRKIVSALCALALVVSLGLAIAVQMATPVHAASSGPNNGGTFADDSSTGTVVWSRPSRARTQNNQYATASLTQSNRISHYLKATDFGFSIPSGATINGILVEVDRYHSGFFSATVSDNSIRLVKGGVISGDDKSTGASWPTYDTNTYASYGGASDLWGLTWSPADINSTGFGVVISAIKDNSSSSRTACVDHIQITVYYNSPPVADSQNGLSVNSCSTLTVTLTGSDLDNDPLTYIISTLPTHGDLYDGTGTGGTNITSVPYTVTDETHNVTYKSDASYSGADSFGFKVNDSTVDSTEATISITVSDGRSTWYQDSDNDTYGNPDVSMLACDQPTGYVSDNTDCDDTDPDVHPGAVEVCNGIDDDCDGLVDDDDPDITGQSTWYQDSDNDTYGNPDVSMLACDQPTGYVSDNTDCDDTDPDVHPGAIEVPYNGKDDDCNPATPDVVYYLIMAADPEVGGTATDLTGESPYAEGAEVSIKAEANEGSKFVNWTATAGEFEDDEAAETTFTMPAQNVTVTANFETGYPTVTTKAATDINANSSTLNMDHNVGKYSPVEVRFAYKKSAGLFWYYTDWVSKSGNGTYAESVTGLSSDTEYDFKAQLKHNDTEIEIEGATLQFTTDTPSPSGGCFIATAAYGTPTAEQIDVLREFRDVVLLESTAGSQFVALYYQFSPPVADFIARNELLRTLVRELLVDPIVWVVEATEDIWRN